jgi:predicted  nucleic acid-binding Zn-ribbon protein
MDERKLQELMERIGRLESELAATRGELTPLKAKLDDLGSAFDMEVKSTSSHFQSVYQYIRDIHVQLWPLVHKVFPGSRETQRQIVSVIKSGAGASDRKKG